jgi:hypothetical protein
MPCPYEKAIPAQPRQDNIRIPKSQGSGKIEREKREFNTEDTESTEITKRKRKITQRKRRSSVDLNGGAGGVRSDLDEAGGYSAGQAVQTSCAGGGVA